MKNSKYKYLKKFNESNGPELSFDDFKDIMSDLTDVLNYEYEFNDNSESKDEPFYDIWIIIPIKSGYELHDDIPYMNFDYLNNESLPPIDSPGEITESLIESAESDIESVIGELIELKSDLDDIIERNKKIKLLFEILKSKILPRLSHFSNLNQCCIGFNGEELRITFDLNENI